jgi:hypothetical protein
LAMKRREWFTGLWKMSQEFTLPYSVASWTF